MGKQLVNYHLRLRVECTLFVIYKARLFCFRTEFEIAVSKYSTKKAFDKSSSFINICMTRYTCVYGGSVNEKPSHQ
jgi:hypothetical protein